MNLPFSMGQVKKPRKRFEKDIKIQVTYNPIQICQRFINFEVPRNLLKESLTAIDEYLTHLTREGEGSILYHKINEVGSSEHG